MKKKFLVIIILILVVIIWILLIKTIKIDNEIARLKLHNTTGVFEYDLSNAPDKISINSKIIIPADLVYVETCCNYNTTFASFKDIDTLKKEVEEILNIYYKKIKDGDKTLYYDEENDLTITEYNVTKGSLVNYVSYTYQ